MPEFQILPEVWVISANYFRGQPIREAFQKSLGPNPLEQEILLLRYREDVLSRVYSNNFPATVFTDGTYRAHNGEHYEEVEFEIPKIFPEYLGITIHVFPRTEG